MRRRHVLITSVLAGMLVFLGPGRPASVSFTAHVTAAPQFPRLPSGLGGLARRLPGLDTFLKPGPVLTTSMSDATGHLGPLPDGVPLGRFASLFSLPRGPRGEFLLRPGRYSAFVQSFCLQPGAHAATHGDGFATAALKGPWADIFEDVIRGAARVPAVPQEDLQVLLWGMLARTKVSAMSRDLQAAAAAVLSPKELLRINGGALSLVPQSVFDSAADQLPDGAREAFEAESHIRQMFADGVSSYEDFEQQAVPDADEARDAGLEISDQQWIDTGRGFYVRFAELGYRNVRVEVVVPPRGSAAQARFDSGFVPVLRLAAWSPAAQPRAEPSPTLDLSAMVAVPANNGQRLGLTTRPSKDIEPTENDDWPAANGRRAENPAGDASPRASANQPSAAAAGAVSDLTPVTIALTEPVVISDQTTPQPAATVDVTERIGVADVVQPRPAAVISIQERINVGDTAGAPRSTQTR